MRYQHLSIVFALAMLQLATARAAGPFDGRWKGSWTGVSNIGTLPMQKLHWERRCECSGSSRHRSNHRGVPGNDRRHSRREREVHRQDRPLRYVGQLLDEAVPSAFHDGKVRHEHERETHEVIRIYGTA